VEILRKYGVQTDIYFPLIKAEEQNFAVSGDYTYASGDIKIIKDGGTATNPTNSPSAITSGNTEIWKLTLTATEMEAALIQITVSDSATKVIEDQAVLIATYGDAAAQHAFDFDAPMPSDTDIADAVLEKVIEGTLTVEEMLRIFMAVLAGKSTGGGTTTVAFRDVADTKDRVEAEVDTSGNRTSITLDPS
jgi:hypothetical protein